jgi:alpha-tubulin suppressor-like RCC1 family protein
VTDVTTALNRTCAIVSGAAKCWSLNTDGALGDGTTGTRLTPVQVTGLTSGVTAISTNDNTTCAVVSGAAKCWGNNTNGQIGDGTTTSRSTPTQVTGLTSGVTAISVGGQHVCAVVSGAAKCWGMNSSSQLGDGTTTSKTTPTTVSGLSSGVTQISAAALGGCVLLTSGGVKCWGDNTNGQLGDGTTTARSTPVAVSGLSSGVTQISANSDSHACAVLTGGGVKCWGGNSVGGLGDGTTTNRSTPVSVVGLGASATSVSTGLVRSCAVLTTGSVYCWGWNSTGQLGDGTTTDNPSPVQVSGITAGAVVTASAWYHSCAVVSVGLKCWGRNTIGQLGDGTTTQRLTPVRTTGLNDVAGTPVSITVTATNAGGSSSTTVTLSVS